MRRILHAVFLLVLALALLPVATAQQTPPEEHDEPARAEPEQHDEPARPEPEQPQEPREAKREEEGPAY